MGIFFKEKTDAELADAIKQTSFRIAWGQANGSDPKTPEMESHREAFDRAVCDLEMRIKDKPLEAISPEIQPLLPIIGSVTGPLYLSNEWINAVAERVVRDLDVVRKNPFTRFADGVKGPSNS